MVFMVVGNKTKPKKKKKENRKKKKSFNNIFCFCKSHKLFLSRDKTNVTQWHNKGTSYRIEEFDKLAGSCSCANFSECTTAKLILQLPVLM